MRERSPKDNSFPHWVALMSLGFALTLFFANTVPALRERDGLQEVGEELEDLAQRYEEAAPLFRRVLAAIRVSAGLGL